MKTKPLSLLTMLIIFGYGTRAYPAYEATKNEQQIVLALRAMHALRKKLTKSESKCESGLSQEEIQKRLFTALERNWQAVIKELVSNYNAQLNKHDNGGITPLCHAATAASPQLAMCLISLGADPNLRPPLGMTPLICAILYNRIDTIKFFLHKGVNIEETSNTGVTPLGYAIRKNKTDIVDCLIRAGADPNASPSNISPLQTACICGYIKIVRMLIEAGARVNLNGTGTSPLHLAAKNGHVRVINLLLSHGANREALTDKRETPLSLAISTRQPEAAALLIEHSAKFNIHKIKKLAKNNCLAQVLCSLIPHILSRPKFLHARWIEIVSSLAEQNGDNFAHWSKTAEGQMCHTLYLLLSPFMRHKPIPYLAQIHTLLTSEVPRVITKEIFDFIGLPWRKIDRHIVTENKETQVNMPQSDDRHLSAKRNQEPNGDESESEDVRLAKRQRPG